MKAFPGCLEFKFMHRVFAFFISVLFFDVVCYRNKYKNIKSLTEEMIAVPIKELKYCVGTGIRTV